MNHLFLIILLLFGIAFFGKLVIMMFKNKIKVSKLGVLKIIAPHQPAEIFARVTFLTLILMCAYCYFCQNPNAGSAVIGLLLMSLGVMLFVITVISMGRSWRVGIQENQDTTLVTTGVYMFSRNMAYISFHTMFLGCIFVYPTWFMIIGYICNIISFHFLIKSEERFLEDKFGNPYIVYKSKTKRYL